MKYHASIVALFLFAFSAFGQGPPPTLTTKVLGDYVFLIWQQPVGEMWVIEQSDDDGENWYISPLAKFTGRIVREVPAGSGIYLIGPPSDYVVVGPEEPIRLYRLRFFQ